jgi:hypothetical protein
MVEANVGKLLFFLSPIKFSRLLELLAICPALVKEESSLSKNCKSLYHWIKIRALGLTDLDTKHDSADLKASSKVLLCIPYHSLCRWRLHCRLKRWNTRSSWRENTLTWSCELSAFFPIFSWIFYGSHDVWSHSNYVQFHRAFAIILQIRVEGTGTHVEQSCNGTVCGVHSILFFAHC